MKRHNIAVTEDTLKQLWRRRLVISLGDRRPIHHVTHDEIIRDSVKAMLTQLTENNDEPIKI